MLEEIGTISTYESGVDFVVEWMIENFFTRTESDDVGYTSPRFSVDAEIWSLAIFPDGLSITNSSGHVDLELCKWSSEGSVKQSISLSLKTAKGEKYKEQNFSKDSGVVYPETYELLRFIPRSELTRRRTELVPEGDLTVVCTMKSSTSAGSATEHSSDSECCHKCSNCLDIVKKQNLLLEELESQKMKRSKGEACASGSSASPYEKKVAHDFKELFLQKEDCDVVIKVKGSEIPAHRLVLKVRSPVFASTFRHDMESAAGVVEIEDCDPSPFSDFLYFLYCGDIEMISCENVFSLFTLADKYEVLDLKAKCLDFIKKNMTVDTFCETITLALQHSETELIALVTDFFVKNAKEIHKTVKWQTFGAENPTQSNELFIKLVKSVKRSNT